MDNRTEQQELYQKIGPTKTEGPKSTYDIKGTPFRNTDPALGELHQLSELHVRSFGSEVVNGKVLWADQYGNRFTAINKKGVPPQGKKPYIWNRTLTIQMILEHIIYAIQLTLMK